MLARLSNGAGQKKIGKTYKKNSLIFYFKRFIAGKGINNIDKQAALIEMFEQLMPVDMNDGILCANIVVCQKTLVDIEEYKEKYLGMAGFSRSANKDFKWSSEQTRQLALSLSTLLESRQRYLKNRFIELSKKEDDFDRQTKSMRDDDDFINVEKIE